MANNFLSAMWVEKYRPSILSDELILDEKTRNTFKSCIENPEKLHHTLLVGEPGTGKTTLSWALINQIIKDPIDVLSFNGSVDNGVDIVREKIMAFLKTPPKASIIKIVFIDEADYLSPNFFAALRATIEQPTFNAQLKTRFIFTANYLNKIPDAIASRCSKYTLNAIPREDIFERCKYILAQENIEFDIETLNKIIDNNYPDMRSIIKTLQMSSQNNKLVYFGNINNDAIVISDTITNICNSVDFNDTIASIYKLRDLNIENINIIEMLSELQEQFINNPIIFTIFNKYQNLMNNAIKPRNTLIAMVYELLRIKFNSQLGI